MKLLKFPILVIVHILKCFDDIAILDMSIASRRMQRLVIQLKLVPGNYKMSVNFDPCILRLSSFRMYYVKNLPATHTTRRQVFDGQVMPIETIGVCRSPDRVHVFANETISGFIKVMLEICAKLNLEKIEAIFVTPKCPITEIFHKLSERRITVGLLGYGGIEEAGQGTRQVFSLPVLKNITRRIWTTVHPGNDFTLPVFPTDINVPHFELGASQWFTMQHLMKLQKAREVLLLHSLISSEDLHSYFVRWMNNEYEDLVSLTIMAAHNHHIHFERVVTGLIENAVITGHPMQADLRRDDGANAALHLNDNTFTCRITKPLVGGADIGNAIGPN